MMKGDFTRDTKRRLTEIKLQLLNLWGLHVEPFLIIGFIFEVY
jgi:hypothetical protein